MARYVLLLRKKQEELWEKPGGKYFAGKLQNPLDYTVTVYFTLEI